MLRQEKQVGGGGAGNASAGEPGCALETGTREMRMRGVRESSRLPVQKLKHEAHTVRVVEVSAGVQDGKGAKLACRVGDLDSIVVEAKIVAAAPSKLHLDLGDRLLGCSHQRVMLQLTDAEVLIAGTGRVPAA